MSKPEGLLNRANLSNEKHALNWTQGKAAARIVHFYLLNRGIGNIVLEEDVQGNNGRQYDLDIRIGEFVLDVKSSQMGVLTVPDGQRRLPCSAYAFVSIDSGNCSWQFWGWIDKEQFWEIAIPARKGEPIDARDGRARWAFYNLHYLRPVNLQPPTTIVELLGD